MPAQLFPLLQGCISKLKSSWVCGRHLTSGATSAAPSVVSVVLQCMYMTHKGQDLWHVYFLRHIFYFLVLRMCKTLSPRCLDSCSGPDKAGPTVRVAGIHFIPWRCDGGRGRHRSCCSTGLASKHTDGVSALGSPASSSFVDSLGSLMQLPVCWRQSV